MPPKNAEHFYSLLSQYKELVLPNEQSANSLASLLDQLNTVETTRTDQLVIDVLVTGCKCISHQEDMAASFYLFIYKQLSKKSRATNFRPAQFDVCINYLLSGLDMEDSNKVDLLRALSALVFENSNMYRPASIARLSKTLLKLADKSKVSSLQIRRMAINCIGNTCSGAGSKLQPYYASFYECLLSNVCTVSHSNHGTIMVTSNMLDFADTAVRKVASSTLRALQFLLSQDKTLVTNPLCDIIDIIHSFVFMNVSVRAYQSSSLHPLLPPTTSSPSATIARRNRLSSQPMAQTATPFSWRSQKSTGLVSSDSELSDSPHSDVTSPRRQRDDAKIRINALLCLSAIANTSPKALYPQWQKFLPDTFSIFLSNHGLEGSQLHPILRSDNQPLSLFTILLYDPAVTVRSAVCHTLVAILNDAKPYLSLALESNKKSKSSFTSFSESLGLILHDIHTGLIYALQKEQVNMVLVVLFQVVTTLVENCTYERLSSNHIPNLYNAIIPHWKNKDLHTSILKALNAIFSIPKQESLNQLCTSDEFINILVQATTTGNDNDEGVEIEGWKLAATTTKSYFAQAMPFIWEKLDENFEKTVMDSSNKKCVDATLRFAEAYAIMIQQCLQQDEGNEELEKYKEWWVKMIGKYLQSASNHSLSSVKVVSCDCFASMSKRVFESLHYRYQRLAVTLLFGLVSDTDSNVRAAACRGLGAFVLFPSLREDPMFVSNMTKSILTQSLDKAIVVRVRSSWAIGNLCDALVLESEKEEFNLREYMSTSEWIEVLNITTAGALDNDKLRSNSVRAIGSLLRITPKEYFDNTRIMSLVKNAVDGLIKNVETGPLKTRWNACHATSNALSNPYFPIGYMEEGGIYPWTHTVYQALCQSLLCCKNFKVRINACLAISTPEREDQYGDKKQLFAIVKSVTDAWDTCQEKTDYKELKYKEQLEEQIIESLKHFRDWIPPTLKEKVDQILDV
ncbi:hypothetical protein K501DRAFT_247598 [Backusella circina FSU 941]|nr:hypothetical protein K501DRAFT_247598 [Backusella circina FSU 941]